VFPELQVKLCDFGLARSKLHTSITWAGREGVGGTFAYMAPEVLVGLLGPDGKVKVVKPQPCSDVWGMGCALLEWYTGKHHWVYKGEDTYHEQVKRKQKLRQPPDMLVDVTGEISSVLTPVFSYDISTRPTAAEMMNKLGT
jgi:serine/threonine protein kinase